MERQDEMHKDRTREEGEDHECKQEATTPIDDDNDDGDKTTATTTTIDDNNGTTTMYFKIPNSFVRPIDQVTSRRETQASTNASDATALIVLSGISRS